MPFISEAASAIKSRFGFHNPSESARATPEVSSRSSFRENLSQFSAIRSFNDRDESRDANSSKGSEMVVRSFELIEEPSFWKDHNVQVIIRLRPLSSSEISNQGYSRCVRQESHQTVTWTGHPETRFTFDLVADETVSQEKLFSVAGVPMVENCVNGYNSCMFAYGQTGSGKTHTMLGDIEGGTRRHSVNSGMTPRVFEHLFSRIQKEKETRREEKMRFTCKCSFLEIYNEHILDLLNPSSSNLHIREDLKKGVYVENLTEIEVSTARDVMQQLQEGSVNRKVAATNMNHASSRSHSVFTCVIESSWESQGVTHHRFARLNLVDLAGSERQKSSGAEGERLKEATNINKSLSTLGLVIMNLVSLSNGKTLHVPYRDSKLTFLLQDSLGGNSKTIIIANISPANSCTLETLSTLKFAQRAKFIKNNAIVNEDASGDVIAMRMQIQQLKKEVTHLRSLAGGASVQDGDSMSMGLLGSPGTFQWEGLNAGAFSPLMSDRRLSQKKEYEAALIGAFRRVKDKDIALQALTAENQAVMQLAKQREEELKALNLRLRFRESGIKRLEAVASGKISAETHLLQEKEELLKEIEVMRSQVNKKQEVTRFAMENLRLNEEIRRLKSFYEEGERERMSEQIMILENKLLEALDWKLMNEPNCTTPKDKTSTVHSAANEENEFLRLQAIHNQGEIDLLRKKLNSCLDEKQKLERHIKNTEAETEDKNGASGDMRIVSVADQMELKAMVDAIAAASQREAEAHEMAITLSRENDELRSRVKVLIEDNKKLIELYESAVTEINNKTNACETMVEDDSTVVTDEKVINAQKLQDLEHQLTEMHEENERLMGMYESAVTEINNKTNACETMVEDDSTVKTDEKVINAQKLQDLEHQLTEMHEENERLMRMYESAVTEINNKTSACETMVEDDSTIIDEKVINAQKLQDLDHQLTEMHEENERLMGMYEKAMLERVSPKVIDSDEQIVTETEEKDGSVKKMEDMEHQLQELHEENERLMGMYEKAMLERVSPTVIDSHEQAVSETEVKDGSVKKMEEMEHQLRELHEENERLMSLYETAMQERDEFKKISSSGVKRNHESSEEDESEKIIEMETDENSPVLIKLDEVKEKLSNSTQFVTEFELLEKAVFEVDQIISEFEGTAKEIQANQEMLRSLNAKAFDLQKRSDVIDKQFSALKFSLSNISSSTGYFEERELKARARVEFAMACLNQMKEELTSLEAQKGETEAALMKNDQAAAEIKGNLAGVESKLEEENKKLESDKVLFAIDNIDNRSWKMGTTELLKSAEEKTKLQNEIKHCNAKLKTITKETVNLKSKVMKVETDIERVSMQIQKASEKNEKLELALNNAIAEKESLLELKENGNVQLDEMVIKFHQCVFDAQLNDEERKTIEAEVSDLAMKLEKLRGDKAAVMKMVTQKLNEGQILSSEKIKGELEEVSMSLLEAEKLLGKCC